jgi:hypothetical protein
VDGHEGSDAVERLGRDPAAIAQAADKFAIIRHTATEGAFGKSDSPTIVCNVSKQILRVHRTTLCRFLLHFVVVAVLLP